MAIIISTVISMSVIVAVAAVYVHIIRKRAELNPRGCPVCDTAVPAFRWPTSFRQALWGGWTCVTCSTEIDRQAMKVPAN